MEVLLLLVMGVMNIVCFMVGAKVGQAVTKGEKIETPTVNPLKAFREREAKKKAEYAQSRIDTIMRNIEAYNGSADGQEDVPR